MSVEHRYTYTRRVAAHPQAVWEVISDHVGMVQWLPFGMSLLEVQGQNHPDGVGAVRSLTSAHGALVERVVAFDDVLRSMDYELVEGLPLRGYTARVSVTPRGDGCSLTSELTVHSQIPGTAALFGFVMTRLTTVGAGRFAERHAQTSALSRRLVRWRQWLTQPAVGILFRLGSAALGVLMSIEQLRTALGPQPVEARTNGHQNPSCGVEFVPSTTAPFQPVVAA